MGLLPDRPFDEPQSHSKTARTWRATACLQTLVLCSITSFLAGRYTGNERPHEVLMKSPFPGIPTTSVTFQADPKFSGESSEASDQAWTSLMPPGEGFILVKQPETYALPPGKPHPNGSLYDLSVYHQLHCLTKIREHLSLLRFAFSQNNSEAVEKFVEPQEKHMWHCFDYLRQGIMCAGDLTLEGPKVGSVGVVDGWGVEHQCRDWGEIERVVDEMSFG